LPCEGEDGTVDDGELGGEVVDDDAGGADDLPLDCVEGPEPQAARSTPSMSSVPAASDLL
jgi:hypothetical protein